MRVNLGNLLYKSTTSYFFTMLSDQFARKHEQEQLQKLRKEIEEKQAELVRHHFHSSGLSS
jgi:uncharacterized membrane-anchored protein YhcB (DUF1043 family)